MDSAILEVCSIETDVVPTNQRDEQQSENIDSRPNIEKETRKSERKSKRNLRQEYITKTNKHIAAKQLKELKTCKNRCKEKFNNEIRLEIFKSFWEMGNYNRRIQYISNLIQLQEKKSIRIRTTDTKKRKLRRNSKVLFNSK